MKHLLIITYWSYKDALIQAYTLPYLKIILKNLAPGSKLYLLTLEQEFYAMSDSEWQTEKHKMQQEGIYLIRFKYVRFGIKMLMKFIGIFISLIFLIFSKRITHIHTWCTPGGAIGYILSLLTFRKLILDSFEPHAALMKETQTWSEDSFAYKTLFRLEKLQAKKALHVIGCVSKMKVYTKTSYNVNLTSFYNKPACVDLDKFNIPKTKDLKLLEELGIENKTVCVYAGKFGGLYLEKETFDFFKQCANHFGDSFHVLLLTNHTIEEIKKYCKQSSFDYHKISQVFVEHKDVPKYLSLADFAINPTKAVPSRRYGTPIKTGEYWAVGLPVVITKDISDDSEIIEQNAIGAIIESLDEKAYKEAILKLDSILASDTLALKTKIRNIAIKYRSFDIAKSVYNEIYK